MTDSTGTFRETNRITDERNLPVNINQGEPP